MKPSAYCETHGQHRHACRCVNPMTLAEARTKAQTLWGNAVGYAHYWNSPLGLLCAVGEIKDADGGFSPYVIAATFEEAFQMCESPTDPRD